MEKSNNNIFPVNKLRLRIAFLIKRSVNMNKANKIYIDNSIDKWMFIPGMKKGKDLNKLYRVLIRYNNLVNELNKAMNDLNPGIGMRQQIGQSNVFPNGGKYTESEWVKLNNS